MAEEEIDLYEEEEREEEEKNLCKYYIIGSFMGSAFMAILSYLGIVIGVPALNEAPPSVRVISYAIPAIVGLVSLGAGLVYALKRCRG